MQNKPYENANRRNKPWLLNNFKGSFICTAIYMALNFVPHVT